VIAAAVTTGMVAAATRRAPRARRAAAKRPAPAPVIPAQRTALALLVEGDADLVVADQDACDARVLEALDQLLAR
jgi:hypothetical protein